MKDPLDVLAYEEPLLPWLNNKLGLSKTISKKKKYGPSLKNNQDKRIYIYIYTEQPCIKSPQSYCICKQLCVSRLMFANRERKISPLVVDDLINGQPSCCARLMMHVNLEGILACLITCCSEIVGVSCTDIYISILTSVITVCNFSPETIMEVDLLFFCWSLKMRVLNSILHVLHW